ncbi:MAG: hypothetical protein HW391_1390 [Chloroflexi bacterium]|nr:hypothetical protein [Chloroflexota bacterium]
MPNLRSILVALAVGAVVAGYTLLWWHWSVAYAAGAGLLLGALALTGTISFGPNIAAADAAWREAASDLLDPPAQPMPDVDAGPGEPRRAEAPGGRIIPSGD